MNYHDSRWRDIERKEDGGAGKRRRGCGGNEEGGCGENGGGGGVRGKEEGELNDSFKGSVTVRYIFVYCRLLSLFAKIL